MICWQLDIFRFNEFYMFLLIIIIFLWKYENSTRLRQLRIILDSWRHLSPQWMQMMKRSTLSGNWVRILLARTTMLQIKSPEKLNHSKKGMEVVGFLFFFIYGSHCHQILILHGFVFKCVLSFSCLFILSEVLQICAL